MAIHTKYSGRIERHSFWAYSGVKPGRLENGSASLLFCELSAASCSSVRCRIQIGLPRHSTVRISPGPMVVRSTSTGAPAARALAEGAKEPTNGTAVATPVTPPTAQAVVTQKRRDGSDGRIDFFSAPLFLGCVVD